MPLLIGTELQKNSARNKITLFSGGNQLLSSEKPKKCQN